MVEFQISNTKYVEMRSAVVRRRLLVAVPALYGALWIVGWILFAIGGGDAWSDVGAMGVLLLVAVPFAALFSFLRTLRTTKRLAHKTFQALTSNGSTCDIQCQLEGGKLLYRFVSINILREIDLNQVKKIGNYQGFFTLEINKSVEYYIPRNSETENLYAQIYEQFTTLKNR